MVECNYTTSPDTTVAGWNAAAGSWLNSAIELRERRFELVEQAAFGVAELANG
jgi:hypothetical protein